jgi:hypothetical protein
MEDGISFSKVASCHFVNMLLGHSNLFDDLIDHVIRSLEMRSILGIW